MDQRGFSLIEGLVATAIFVVMSLVVTQAFFLIYKNADTNWQNITISSLGREYLENARNIAYSQLGTIQGTPQGVLPDISDPSTVTVSDTPYEIYYEITYVDDPADGTAALGTDSDPDDYKQVKLSVKNVTTGQISTFYTNIAPGGLEDTKSGGSLSLNVTNAIGQPVANATVNITNNLVTPSINLSGITDGSGNLIEVGLPDSVNGYHVVVTKNGYSTDQTYPITEGNPNPTKPDATIANGQITKISFAIDQTSNLTFNTLDQSCNTLSGVGIEIKGEKLIGTPDIVKYDNTFTSNGGRKFLYQTSNGIITYPR